MRRRTVIDPTWTTVAIWYGTLAVALVPSRYRHAAQVGLTVLVSRAHGHGQEWIVEKTLELRSKQATLATRVELLHEGQRINAEHFDRRYDELAERIDRIEGFPLGSGVSSIAEERFQQLTRWTAEHDDAHLPGELLDAAIAYAIYGWWQTSRDASGNPSGWTQAQVDEIVGEQWWPWDERDWKPSDDGTRNLVKAGALLAAEIDRARRNR